MEDNLFLVEDSRIGLVLYAAKCAYLSGDDEGEKFRYLRLISNMWAERGWDKDDKRIILLAVNYLINLKSETYAKDFVAHMESLRMSKEDKEMYVSVFERVYTSKGKEKGQAELVKNMLNEGLSVDEIIKYTRLTREGIEKLRKL